VAACILIVEDMRPNLHLTAPAWSRSAITPILKPRAKTRTVLVVDNVQANLNLSASHRLSSIPFIFITSTATTERDRLRGLALGAAKFLFRPIEPQQLLNEVEDRLAQTDEP
jgi:PleD family two-component response regulator